MSEDASGAEPAAPAVSQAQLQKAEAYVEAEEGVVNRLFGWAGSLVTSIAVAMSLFHLYAAVAGAWPFTDFPIIATQPLRYAHVAFVLMLSFLLFPLSARFRDRIRWWDIAAGIMGAAILIYAIEGGIAWHVAERECPQDCAIVRAKFGHRVRRSIHKPYVGAVKGYAVW